MFLGDENTVFVKQKDYIFFLGGSPSARNLKRIWIIWIISSTNENNIYIDRLRRLKEKEYTTEIWIIIILIRGIIIQIIQIRFQ